MLGREETRRPTPRRARVLSRVVQLGRRAKPEAEPAEPRPPAPSGAERLEARIDQLEALLHGLQDAVHREAVRQTRRIEELERKTTPAELSRALSRDARERGI
jgi:hypothetical protein